MPSCHALRTLIRVPCTAASRGLAALLTSPARPCCPWAQVEGAPKVVKEGLKKEEAEALQKTLVEGERALPASRALFPAGTPVVCLPTGLVRSEAVKAMETEGERAGAGRHAARAANQGADPRSGAPPLPLPASAAGAKVSLE